MSRQTDTEKNAILDARKSQYDAGKIKIYAGTRAVSGVTTIGGGHTLLATLTLNATAFPVAASGVQTANAVTQDSDAAATGTPSFAHLTTSDGTVLDDCSVGTSGAEVNISSLSIAQHDIVTCSSLTRSLPDVG